MKYTTFSRNPHEEIGNLVFGFLKYCGKIKMLSSGLVYEVRILEMLRRNFEKKEDEQYD